MCVKATGASLKTVETNCFLFLSWQAIGVVNISENSLRQSFNEKARTAATLRFIGKYKKPGGNVIINLSSTIFSLLFYKLVDNNGNKTRNIE